MNEDKVLRFLDQWWSQTKAASEARGDTDRALDYFRRRGVERAASLYDWTLAPWSRLRNLPEEWREYLIRSGFLVGKKKDFPVTSGALSFALRDIYGRLVGWHKRTSWGDVRYLSWWDRDLLFVDPLLGLWEQVEQWEAEGWPEDRILILTEGPFDLLSVKEADPSLGAIALAGLGLRTERMHLLRRFARRFLLFLDDDESGREAADKIERALKDAGGEVARVRSYHGAKDPNEILTAVGADSLRQSLEVGVFL